MPSAWMRWAQPCIFSQARAARAGGKKRLKCWASASDSPRQRVQSKRRAVIPRAFALENCNCYWPVFDPWPVVEGVGESGRGALAGLVAGGVLITGALAPG